jgi:hypothetical protein
VRRGLRRRAGRLEREPLAVERAAEPRERLEGDPELRDREEEAPGRAGGAHGEAAELEGGREGEGPVRPARPRDGADERREHDGDARRAREEVGALDGAEVDGGRGGAAERAHLEERGAGRRERGDADEREGDDHRAGARGERVEGGGGGHRGGAYRARPGGGRETGYLCTSNQVGSTTRLP